MFKARLFILIAALFSITVLASCTLSDNDLKDGWWKCGGVAGIGDVINFNNTHSLKQDTILFGEKRIGIITKRTKGYLGNDNTIEVSSVDKKEKAIYYQK